MIAHIPKFFASVLLQRIVVGGIAVMLVAILLQAYLLLSQVLHQSNSPGTTDPVEIAINLGSEPVDQTDQTVDTYQLLTAPLVEIGTDSPIPTASSSELDISVRSTLLTAELPVEEETAVASEESTLDLNARLDMLTAPLLDESAESGNDTTP